MKNASIVVAGGLGQRMNSAVPKQFLSLLGKPVVQWSLECFDNVESIKKIILVLPEDWIEEGKKYLSAFKPRKEFAIVLGGKLRQDSVRNGLNALGEDFDFVAVHDAARPGVEPKIIEKAFATARKMGSAVFAVPSYDTLARVIDNEIVDNIDRNVVFRVQTPQIFPLAVLNKALKMAREKDVVATDEATLVRMLGQRVFIVNGSERMGKITTAEDLNKAEFLLDKR